MHSKGALIDAASRREPAAPPGLGRFAADVAPQDASLLERVHAVFAVRDAAAAEHVHRMAAVSAWLGERLGMTGDQADMVRAAASLHDIGKLTVSSAILRKPDALSPAERAIVERHALAGHQMLSGADTPIFRLAATIALSHHERWDGGGYPLGLRARQIPLVGRIAAVADVFDALLSPRPYRPALPLADALEILRDGRGSQFDPEALDALLDDLRGTMAVRSASITAVSWSEGVACERLAVLRGRA